MSLTDSEPFQTAMELMDCAKMCGAQNADVADFVVSFMKDVGIFDSEGKIARQYISDDRKARPSKPYTPRNDPALWTPRLPDREWWTLRGKVLRRDGFICSYCKDEDGPFEIDHIIPVTRGGSNDLSNLCVACKPCNSSKGDRLLSEWRGRYR